MLMQEHSNMRIYDSTGTQIYTTTRILGCTSILPHEYTNKLVHINIIYHRNSGVIQGFPALRKAVTTHVKTYRIFSRVLIKPISR